jgi:hypothetical protein
MKVEKSTATTTPTSQRKPGLLKDRVTRALTKPDQDKPAKSGPSKVARKASSGAA